MKERVNNFDVLKEMGKRNLKMTLSPLGNITYMRKVKAGTQLTIDVGQHVITGLLLGEYVGGLILADKTEFDAVAQELQDAAVRSPESHQAPTSGAQGDA